jgi:CheY-like chemotaxis protein
MDTADEVEILLVEDNENDAELAIRALRKHNLANRLVHVKDGAEALDFIFATGDYAQRHIENGPKVIMLDLKLPKIDGLEVLQRIKSDARTHLIPVVVMTSSTEESDMIESYQLGVNSFIVKPIEFEAFVRAVSDVGYYWMLLNKRPQ